MTTNPYDARIALLDQLIADPQDRRPAFGSTSETSTERATLGRRVTTAQEIFEDAPARVRS